jgi:hypothetical protein
MFHEERGISQKFNENIPISFPTPAERTTIPTVVSRSFSSVRMRQRTGKAVIEYATPVNNIKWVNTISGLINSLYTACAIPAPMPKGKIIPARATVAERRAFRLITPASISRPTRKRKRHSPILATRLRYGRESTGKMCSVNPGIRPKAVGPSYYVC